MLNRKKRKSSRHKKRVSNRKKKTTKKMHQNNVVTVDVSRSSASSLSYASCLGLSCMSCVMTLVYVVLLACCRHRAQERRVRRRRRHRRSCAGDCCWSHHWRLLCCSVRGFVLALQVSFCRRNSGRVESGQPNPYVAHVLKNKPAIPALTL